MELKLDPYHQDSPSGDCHYTHHFLDNRMKFTGRQQTVNFPATI